jgi:hypothetical protein
MIIRLGCAAAVQQLVFLSNSPRRRNASAQRTINLAQKASFRIQRK